MSADYFYPDYITGTCNISMDESLMELKRLVDDGILELKFEIQTDGKVVKTINDFREYYGKEITYEGKTFVVTFDNVFPCYYISEEYKKYCLKN